MNVDLRRGADVGELGVLGEKAVARVDRVGAGDLGGGDQARNVEIRLARRRRADADVVVGEANVERLAIGLGVHGDRLHAELAAGADDAQRDLAAVGDEDFLEHPGRGAGWGEDLAEERVGPSARLLAPLPRPLPASLIGSPSNAAHDVSLVPATPCTRSANSAGLVA